MLISNRLSYNMPSTNNKNQDNELTTVQNDGSIRKFRIRKRRFHPTTFRLYCVNAIDGEPYPWKSGSFEELRLYKVINTTGFYTKDGFVRNRDEELCRDPIFLYYDSPEQYSRHMRVNLDQTHCAKWHEKVNRYFPNGEFDRTAYENDKANNDVSTQHYSTDDNSNDSL